MDVKEFLSEALSQIVDGVVDAQQRTKDKNAVAEVSGEPCQKVSLDAAVTVVEGKEMTGKAGISVWSIGAGIGGKSETPSSTVSTIQFAIPVELPPGSEEPELPSHTG